MISISDILSLINEVKNIHDVRIRQKQIATLCSSITFKQMPLLFEPNTGVWEYFDGVKIAENNKKISIKELLLDSYLIKGEAGCGKSSFLQNDYLLNKENNKYKAEICHLYFNSELLIDFAKRKEIFYKFMHLLQSVRYKKIFFYIDGIDEVGSERIENIVELFNKLKMINVVYKISCRTDFFERYLDKDEGSKILINGLRILDVKKWNKNSLNSYAKILIKSVRGVSNVNYKKDIKWFKDNNTDWTDYIDSPMLVKLLVYIICNDKFETEDFSRGSIGYKNKYKFYSNFIEVLIKTCIRNNNCKTESDIGAYVNKIAASAFESYINQSKNIDVDYKKIIGPILKPTLSGENNFSFVHETFFEFFVARYYYQTINGNIDHINVRALCVDYSNQYADFISAACLSLNKFEQETLSIKICDIYYFTLADNVKAGFWYHPLTQINKMIFIKLNEEEFFNLKYGLIFRLGRFHYPHERIPSFLEFIYNNDENTRQKDKYYLAVIKRCCAISSSFIGSENIELDYVKHMLDGIEGLEYECNYDLANRSHTMLFYGDIINQNIFSFMDTDLNRSFSMAFNKRIERLRYALPSMIDFENQKQKRNMYFRLFDLATIYTFIYSRNIPLKRMHLNIIKKTIVDFQNISIERRELMKTIKASILRFHNQMRKKHRDPNY